MHRPELSQCANVLERRPQKDWTQHGQEAPSSTDDPDCLNAKIYSSVNLLFLVACRHISAILREKQTPKVHYIQSQERPNYTTFCTPLQLVWCVDLCDKGTFFVIIFETLFLVIKG